MKVKLITSILSGLAENENGELVNILPFIGKIGTVLDRQDTGYDTERPTGYEPVYYLVDFENEKLWIPFSSYLGRGEIIHLRRV